MSPLPTRRGAYGFDAPFAPLLTALGGAGLLALSAWELWRGDINSTQRAISVFAPAVVALWLFLNAGIFIHTTRAGKFAVWAELLDGLGLKGASGCSTSAAAAAQCC